LNGIPLRAVKMPTSDHPPSASAFTLRPVLNHGVSQMGDTTIR